MRVAGRASNKGCDLNRQSYLEVAEVELQVVADLGALGKAAAHQFTTLATSAIKNMGQFTVALSGGDTPRTLFSHLASGAGEAIDWSSVHVFWGDERHVPPMDTASNYRLAKECLLDAVQIPRANIHRIRSEEAAKEAARVYEAELRQFFDLAAGTWPRFDLVLLGLGDDGHTASLFPGMAALRERDHLAVSTFVPQTNAERITMTYPVINAASCVLVLVSGASKAAVVEAVLNNPPHLDELPMQGVHPRDGQLVWLLDVSAAGSINFSKPALE